MGAGDDKNMGGLEVLKSKKRLGTMELLMYSCW